jgi:hypothetical protein
MPWQVGQVPGPKPRCVDGEGRTPSAPWQEGQAAWIPPDGWGWAGGGRKAASPAPPGVRTERANATAPAAKRSTARRTTAAAERGFTDGP